MPGNRYPIAVGGECIDENNVVPTIGTTKKGPTVLDENPEPVRIRKLKILSSGFNDTAVHFHGIDPAAGTIAQHGLGDCSTAKPDDEDVPKIGAQRERKVREISVFGTWSKGIAQVHFTLNEAAEVHGPPTTVQVIHTDGVILRIRLKNLPQTRIPFLKPAGIDRSRQDPGQCVKR